VATVTFVDAGTAARCHGRRRERDYTVTHSSEYLFWDANPNKGFHRQVYGLE